MTAIATPLFLLRTAPLYERVEARHSRRSNGRSSPTMSTPSSSLKRERNAVILAHNYQTPEIFHCVADIVGDSLALAREAMKVDADVIVLAGVHFMAETAKLLNPDKTVLIPDPAAGCSLADFDHGRTMCACCARRYPGVPIVTYVNTSAAVKAESDICCTSGNAEAIVESLGVEARDHAARRISGRRTSPPRPTSRSSPGRAIARCMSASAPRTSASCARTIRASSCWPIPNARPKCVAEADFAGSTAAMSDYVAATQAAARRAPDRMLDERQCRRAASRARVRPPLQSLPAYEADHACRISAQPLETNRHEVTIDPAIAGRARRPSSGCWRSDATGSTSSRRRMPVIIGGRPRRADDGAASGAAAGHRCCRERLWGRGPPAPGRRAALPPSIGRRRRSGAASCRHARRRRRTLRRRRRSRLCEPAPATIEALGALWASASTATRTAASLLGLEAAHSRRRIVHAGGDATGRRDHAGPGRSGRAQRPRSPCSRASMRASLIVEDDAVIGVRMSLGQRARSRSPRTASSSRPAASAGYSLTRPIRRAASARAWRSPRGAGSRLADLEFVQFHPTALDVAPDPMALVSEAVRGEGAVLVDETGRRFMAGQPGAELAPRDVVARAIWQPSRQGASRLSRRAPAPWARVRRALSDHRRRSAKAPASIRRRSPSRCGRRPIIIWAASPWTAPGAAPSTGCGRAAKLPAPGCTAPTGSPAIRCWKPPPAPPGSPRTSPDRALRAGVRRRSTRSLEHLRRRPTRPWCDRSCRAASASCEIAKG